MADAYTVVTRDREDWDTPPFDMNVLIGPDGFEFEEPEPQDATFRRDLEHLVKELNKQAERLASLAEENERLRAGLDAVESLIASSDGVSGLHLNGDMAPWDELRTGGHFQEWLSEFDAALASREAAEGESDG